MRILIVEDEKKIANFIERGLKEQRYAVDVAMDGEKGSFLADINPYDLIILDVMLPGMDGFSLCRDIRKKKLDVPILMLTAKDKVIDKVRGFEGGADDYLTKPFAFEELLARVGVLLRRRNAALPSVLKVGDLEIDQLKHSVKRGGKEITLTGKEYALIEYLARNAGHVVTRTMISEHVWNEDFDSFSNVVDVYINHLRNKVDKAAKKPLIHSIRGTGYVLKE
ncbi:MAG: response regulator transcription factor [Candidatus Omnitrophica bacterium]|nr:response regulator transcription factor [Candidatus Omnitrophota bacterium]